MTGGTAAALRVIADDLTGAVEAAGVLHSIGIPAAVHLNDATPTEFSTVRDLDIRNLDAADAARIAHEAFFGATKPDYVKIDSQLRGPITALVDAARAVAHSVVLCPALPRLNRTVVDGVLLLDGIPLAESPGSAWRTEAADAPTSIEALLGPTTPHRTVPLRQLRDPSSLNTVLEDAEDGVVLLVDAQTDADLDLLARGLHSSAREIVPIGGSAFLRALHDGGHAPTRRDPRIPVPRVLFVIGTLEPITRAQRERLHYPEVNGAEPDAALRTGTALHEHGGAVLVTAPHAGNHDPAVAKRLAAVTAAALEGDAEVALVLIGGETARSVLAALGEDDLRVVDVIHDGAVRAVSASGRPVVTRPGSFGGPDSLQLIARTLLGGDRRVHQLEEGRP